MLVLKQFQNFLFKIGFSVRFPVLKVFRYKAMDRNHETRLYESRPLTIGIEVLGLDLKQPLTDDVKHKIMEDVTKYRVVVFRNQGIVPGFRQVEISEWFGDIDNVTYSKHPASPSVDIFRVSNDPNEGCTGVGMSGWHIDGTFRRCPYAYSIYHMVSPAIKGGNTMFIPLTEIVESLSPDQRKSWNRLWMVSDRLGGICHPLIYYHPKTGRPTLCFHQGMTCGFARDYDKNKESNALLSEKENREILEDIQSVIERTTIYSHKWQEAGDFIISDNLAVGHMAGPISPFIKEAGLRILHRVTVKGTLPPSKNKEASFPYKNKCAY